MDTTTPEVVYSHGKLPPGITRSPNGAPKGIKRPSPRAKLHALTHVPTSPEQRRMNQLSYYRKLLSEGETVRAEEYAKMHSLEVPMATLADELVGDLPPVPQVGAPPPPIPLAAATAALSGWPEHARVVVWTTCPNPKLVVARLPDGRQVSLWKEGLPTRPVGIECDVHIEKRTGDPIYRVTAPPSAV